MLKLAGRPAPAPALESLMTAHPEVLRADDTVATAIHKMAVGALRHVPLTNDDGSITVVAARDIFRHLAARLG
jgi:CBS domain-containing protein